jgi:hypothetical protein
MESILRQVPGGEWGLISVFLLLLVAGCVLYIRHINKRGLNKQKRLTLEEQKKLNQRRKANPKRYGTVLYTDPITKEINL